MAKFYFKTARIRKVGEYEVCKADIAAHLGVTVEQYTSAIYAVTDMLGSDPEKLIVEGLDPNAEIAKVLGMDPDEYRRLDREFMATQKNLLKEPGPFTEFESSLISGSLPEREAT